MSTARDEEDRAITCDVVVVVVVVRVRTVLVRLRLAAVVAITIQQQARHDVQRTAAAQRADMSGGRLCDHNDLHNNNHAATTTIAAAAATNSTTTRRTTRTYQQARQSRCHDPRCLPCRASACATPQWGATSTLRTRASPSCCSCACAATTAATTRTRARRGVVGAPLR